MTATKRIGFRAMLVGSALVAVSPTLALANPSACYESTISWCNQTLASTPWYEKWIIGDACAAMMVGCALQQ
ncbi:MAG: hypothetical protein M3Z18_11425 [Gemmatimonadota bacterium]|nr:hypothetical protein [Gemmatimonadota bacterium]